jgi:hypothetical protein
VHRSLHATKDDAKIEEGKQVVAALAKLKYELQHDRELTPIPDDGERDVQAYNAELAARGSPKWHSVAWLYAECYLYRYADHMRCKDDADGHSKTHSQHLQADVPLALL